MKNKKEKVFYRMGPYCVRKTSTITARWIFVPANNDYLPLKFEDQAYVDEATLDAILAKMEECDEEDYNAYVATFFQKADRLREVFNKEMQKKWDIKNNKDDREGIKGAGN